MCAVDKDSQGERHLKNLFTSKKAFKKCETINGSQSRGGKSMKGEEKDLNTKQIIDVKAVVAPGKNMSLCKSLIKYEIICSWL